MAGRAPSKKVSRLGSLRMTGSESSTDIADWSSANPALLLDLISATTALNGAIRFGYTRDGGAYSVGVYLDDDRETFYFRPGGDLDTDLENLLEKVRSLK